jgi:hypothetical protein
VAARDELGVSTGPGSPWGLQRPVQRSCQWLCSELIRWISGTDGVRQLADEALLWWEMSMGEMQWQVGRCKDFKVALRWYNCEIRRSWTACPLQLISRCGTRRGLS